MGGVNRKAISEHKANRVPIILHAPLHVKHFRAGCRDHAHLRKLCTALLLESLLPRSLRGGVKPLRLGPLTALAILFLLRRRRLRLALFLLWGWWGRGGLKL